MVSCMFTEFSYGLVLLSVIDTDGIVCNRDTWAVSTKDEVAYI